MDAADATRLTACELMSRYTSVTDADRRAMLGAIGVGSVEELFADIPAGLRLDRPLDARRRAVRAGGLRGAARARGAQPSRRGRGLASSAPGMYDHYVPALIDSIIQRSEFLTPYTPYQPEISQGGLQVMFEYQTAISELTGLPVSNASVYEGPSAVAAAGLPREAGERARRKLRRLARRPPSLARCAAHARARATDGGRRGAARRRRHRPSAADASTTTPRAVIVQQPNFLGAVEDLSALAGGRAGGGRAGRSARATRCRSAILKPPGE